MEAVGRRIRAELDRQQMPVAEFARRLEIDPRTAARISRGQGRFTISTAFRVAYVLMMPINSLFEDQPYEGQVAA